MERPVAQTVKTSRIIATGIAVSAVAFLAILVTGVPPNRAHAAESKIEDRAKKREAALAARKSGYQKEILPLLEEYCFDCHGDGVSKGDIAW